MRYLILSLSLLLLPLSVNAKPQMRKSQIDFGLGMNSCSENGDDAKCDDIDGGFGIRAGYTFRFLPFLGAGLDFHWGSWSTELPEGAPEEAEEPSLSTISVIPMLRGFYGVGPVGLNLGLGMGYYGTSVEVGDTTFSNSTVTAFKLSVGAAYKISGKMGVGLYYDMIMGANGEPSIDPEPELPAGVTAPEPEAIDFQGNTQIGLNFYYRL